MGRLPLSSAPAMMWLAMMVLPLPVGACNTMRRWPSLMAFRTEAIAVACRGRKGFRLSVTANKGGIRPLSYRDRVLGDSSPILQTARSDRDSF